MTKPFSPREVVLRITAILRRAEPPVSEMRLSGADLVIDFTVSEAGQKIVEQVGFVPIR